MQTHFVFNGSDSHIIPCSKLSIYFNQRMGNEKQTQSTRPFRSPLDAGKHSMNRIFSKISVSIADPAFRTFDPVGPIPCIFSGSQSGSDIGPSMRFTEAHCPVEFPPVHSLDVFRFQLLAAERLHQSCCPDGKFKMGRQAGISGVDAFIHC